MRGKFNTKAVEIQTNWPIRVSHGYKYSPARAILRDGGMGKFGLESQVCQRRPISLPRHGKKTESSAGRRKDGRRVQMTDPGA